MSDDPKHVTDAEFSVLEVLWRLGATTTRRVTEELYPAGTDSDYATVQKLLHRLEAKRYVERDRSQFVHVVKPTATRTQFVDRQLHAVAKKLSGGSLVPLLIHLVEAEKLSPREREKIRTLLEEAH